MQANPTEIVDTRYRLINYLRSQGFTVAKTERGFVAVDEDGLVITCSPGRTHICIVHPNTGQYMEHRCNGLPDAKWFDGMIEEFVMWSKDQ